MAHTVPTLPPEVMEAIVQHLQLWPLREWHSDSEVVPVAEYDEENTRANLKTLVALCRTSKGCYSLAKPYMMEATVCHYEALVDETDAPEVAALVPSAQKHTRSNLSSPLTYYINSSEVDRPLHHVRRVHLDCRTLYDTNPHALRQDLSSTECPLSALSLCCHVTHLSVKLALSPMADLRRQEDGGQLASSLAKSMSNLQVLRIDTAVIDFGIEFLSLLLSEPGSSAALKVLHMRNLRLVREAEVSDLYKILEKLSGLESLHLPIPSHELQDGDVARCAKLELPCLRTVGIACGGKGFPIPGLSLVNTAKVNTIHLHCNELVNTIHLHCNELHPNLNRDLSMWASARLLRIEFCEFSSVVKGKNLVLPRSIDGVEIIGQLRLLVLLRGLVSVIDALAEQTRPLVLRVWPPREYSWPADRMNRSFGVEDLVKEHEDLHKAYVAFRYKACKLLDHKGIELVPYDIKEIIDVAYQAKVDAIMEQTVPPPSPGMVALMERVRNYEPGDLSAHFSWLRSD